MRREERKLKEKKSNRLQGQTSANDSLAKILYFRAVRSLTHSIGHCSMIDYDIGKNFDEEKIK